MKKSLIKTALGLGAALLVAGQAQADLITDWNWTLDSAWTVASPALGLDPSTDVIGSNPLTVNGTAGFGTLSWGQNSAGTQSSLVITNPNLDSTNDSATLFELVDIGGGLYSDTVDGTLFIHNNVTIRRPWLTAMTLTDLFTITAVGAGSPSATTNPDFDWSFVETFNEDDIGDCFADDAGPTPCSDIMVLNDAAPLQFSFSEDGYIYTVTVGAAGLGLLPDSACAEAGEDSPCIGLITPEDASTPFQFFINLTATARQVSEPSILALMGLGLLGIGYRRRKNRK